MIVTACDGINLAVVMSAAEARVVCITGAIIEPAQKAMIGEVLRRAGVVFSPEDVSTVLDGFEISTRPYLKVHHADDCTCEVCTVVEKDPNGPAKKPTVH